MHFSKPCPLAPIAVALAVTLVTGKSFLPASEPAKAERAAEIRVGADDGDIRGNDNRALQAAVDYVAGLGGGTVHIGPGRYQMRNGLMLRSNVRVVGVSGKTILAACDGFQTPLAADGDCNQRAITVADSSGFKVGDGVAIVDDRYGGGFEVTTATITAQEGPNTFRISRPLYVDYLVSRKAKARLVFPVVAGYEVKNAAVEGLIVDGNRAKSLALDGCRGGGIYLFESVDISIRNCTVQACGGDGISFQVSSKVTVENCLTHDNAGHGLHPGSGSQHPILRGNRSFANGQDGLYVCWRVQHGVFDGNILQDNKRSGISIGHKDSDNLFQHNHITGNDSAGITFRNESEAMGAHRNHFEKNIILDNGTSQSKAAVVMHGVHHDIIFQGNVIGYSKAGAGTGIRASSASKGLKAEENEFKNVGVKVKVE